MSKNPKRHERLIIYQAKLSSMFKLHFFIPQETLHSTTVVIETYLVLFTLGIPNLIGHIYFGILHAYNLLFIIDDRKLFIEYRK